MKLTWYWSEIDIRWNQVAMKLKQNCYDNEMILEWNWNESVMKVQWNREGIWNKIGKILKWKGKEM